MNLVDCYQAKTDAGKQQIRTVLATLKERHDEYFKQIDDTNKKEKIIPPTERKTPWYQKNELWGKLGNKQRTMQGIIAQKSKKPFEHYTAFERILEELVEIGIVEKNKIVVIKCPKCKNLTEAASTVCIECGRPLPSRIKEKKKENTFYRLVTRPKEIGYKDIVFTDKLFLDWYDKEEFTSIPHVNVYGSRLPYFEPRVKEILEKIKNLTLELYNLKKEETGDNRHITIVSKSTNVGFVDIPVLSELPQNELT